jgi:hypothetical protein
MAGSLKKMAVDRLSGDRPSPARAFLGAAVAGAATAVVTYKVLRS